MKGQTRSATSHRQILERILPISAILLASIANAGQWSRFRGPNGQGISYDKNIPAKWTHQDYNWKVTLPGNGHSSPVVWDNKVFITCSPPNAPAGKLLALRVSDGEVLWQKQFTLPAYKMNQRNNYAAGTPAVDADYLYTAWGTPEQTLLEAFDHDGKEIWKRTFPGVKSQHGPYNSPVVFDDILVFTHEHEDTSDKTALSFWIALDRKTGKTRWQLPRTTGPKTSYSTPCLHASLLVFTSFSHGMTGVDPRTGKIVWEASSAFEARVVSSPVIADGLVLGTCGSGSAGKYIIAVKPNANAKPTEAYKIERTAAAYVPTSLALDGLLFTYHDRGQVSCLNAKTGKLIWQEKPAGRYYGSPVWVDGKLYAITVDGDVVVIKAGPKYQLLAVNPLGQGSQATPAVAAGRMYLRTNSQLFSIGGAKK